MDTMNDEEIRAKIKRSIFTAFDRWAAQNFDVLFDPSTRKENPERIEADRLEDAFMIRRVHDIGFFRYVTREVVASEDCLRQFRNITRAAILSILHPTISVGDLERKSAGDDLYTRRYLQDLIKRTYTETFFEPGERWKEKTLSDTVGAYSTVFSPHVEPTLDNPKIVKDFQAFDKFLMDNNPKFKAGVELNGQVQPAVPEYQQSFLTFKKLCKDILIEIGDYSVTGKILAEELGDLTSTLIIFHNHMLSIVSIEWYRGRQEATQKALLQEPHPLEYSEEDAAVLVKFLLELFGSEEQAAGMISDICTGLAQYKRLDVCLLLYAQSLKFGSLSPLSKGILHENLATFLRDLRPPKPKLMVSEMKQAVKMYGMSGDQYRVCVALKNLGEAEWKLGYKDLGMKYFDQAKAESAKLGQEDRANVLANLAVAAMRVGDTKLEIRYLGECLKEAPQEWTEKILRINERLGELTR